MHVGGILMMEGFGNMVGLIDKKAAECYHQMAGISL